MALLTTCPNRNQLLETLAGRLPVDLNNAVADHLEQCTTCQASIAEVSQQDTLIEALRDRDTVLNFTPDDQQRVQRIIAHSHRESSLISDSIGPSCSGFTDPSVAQSFLSPPSAPTAPLFPFLSARQNDSELGGLGKYRVLRVLGMGGMGIVFEALDPELKRRVALKVMQPKWSRDAWACKRYLREAQLSAAIEHDHIVTIFEVNSEHAVPYLAMQLLKGESLQARLNRESSFRTLDCLRIGREIAAALAAAHDRSLIHRDIKPDNIWLEAGTERVKILDFGLARPIADDASLTHAGTLVGTPAYMSPEQASGQPADCRSDLYSLGVVLYRMATGRLPFPGSTTFEMLKSVLLEIPVAPWLVNPAVPRAVSDLIDQLLMKDRDARPAGAAEVVQRLAALEAEAARQSDGASDCTSSIKRTRLQTSLWFAFAISTALLLAVIVIRIRTNDGKVNEVTVSIPGEVESATIEFADKKPALSATMVIPAASSATPGRGPFLPSMNLSALVRTPAKLAGLESWTLETVAHRVPVISMAFSPNSKLLATLDVIGQIRIWDTASGALKCVLIDDVPNLLGSIAWSPDNARIVKSNGFVPSKVGLVIWNVESGKLELKIETSSPAIACGFMPRGDQAFSIHQTAGTERGGLKTWDVNTGRQIDQFDADTLHGDLSPDRKMVAFTSREDHKIRVFELDARRFKWDYTILDPRFGDSNSHRPVWSPDGKLIAVSPGHGLQRIQLLDTASGQLTFEVQATGTNVFHPGPVAWSADSRRLFVGCAWNTDNGGLQVIDATTGKFTRTGRGTGSRIGGAWTMNIALSPDGVWQTTSDNLSGTLYWCQGDTGEPRRTIAMFSQSMLLGLQWLNDHQTIVPQHYGNLSTSWNVTSGKLQRRPVNVPMLISPDGTRSISTDNEIDFKIWDFATQTVKKHLPHAGTGMGSMAWSSNSTIVATGNRSGSSTQIKVWDAETGDLKAEFQNPFLGGPIELALSSDGTWLAMGKSGQDRILIFDCRNQKVHETLPLSGTTALSLAFAPDNAALAIGQQTGKVKILVLSPTESFRSSDRKFGPLEFAAHQNPVTQIAWSRDGRTLATGCNAYFVFGTRSDGEIRLWSAPTGAFQGELLPMDHDKSIVIAPTGHYQAQPSETVIKHNFITYVIQTPGGQQTLTPDDFEQRFRWKNNPHFVRVDQMP